MDRRLTFEHDQSDRGLWAVGIQLIYEDGAAARVSGWSGITSGSAHNRSYASDLALQIGEWRAMQELDGHDIYYSAPQSKL